MGKRGRERGKKEEEEKKMRTKDKLGNKICNMYSRQMLNYP